MEKQPQSVVLLSCGSFNPITNMHLRMFELARDSLNKSGKYRVVGGIISPVNDAYEKQGLLSSKHRTAMIRLALESSDWIRLDTWECEQSGWFHTLKVLEHHRKALESACNANPPPDTPTKKRKLDDNMSPADEVHYTNFFNLNEGSGPPQLKLLCGADMLESFAVPGLWDEQDIEDIVHKYGLVCITRANATHPEKFIYESDVLSTHRSNIHIVTEWIHNEISSTKIRRALRRSESVKYLVQDSVVDYIKSHGLYLPLDNRHCNQRRTPSPQNDHDPDMLFLDSLSPTMLSPLIALRGRSPPTRRLQHQPYSYQDSQDTIVIARSFSLDTETSRMSQLRSQSLDCDNKPRTNRRHLNYDEEFRRCQRNSSAEDVQRNRVEYRKTCSMDSFDSSRKHAPSRENSLDSTDYNRRRIGYRRQDSVESTESQRTHSFYKRDDSVDSVTSERSTSRSPNRPVSCMGMADISGLMRRVRGMRVAVTPETCV